MCYSEDVPAEDITLEKKDLQEENVNSEGNEHYPNKDKKCINKEERVRHLPGYCR